MLVIGLDTGLTTTGFAAVRKAGSSVEVAPSSNLASATRAAL